MDRLPSLLGRVGASALDALRTPAQRRAHALAGRPPTRAIVADRIGAELEEAHKRFEESEEAGRAFVAGIRLEVTESPPPDPFSPAYAAWTWDLYRRISGRDEYSTDNESSPFDLGQALVRPFPYSTGSAEVLGDDLLSRGFAVSAVDLVPPARIVEFGPGWGNLTIDLARVGFYVTGVEVDEQFCALIGQRCATPERLTMVRDDMLAFATAPARREDPFDGAVFYESFHHCADHLAMLRALHDVVVPGGPVVLASEPVDYLEFPWGPRTDGMSLWSMWRYGWLELGFDPEYFADALARTGWQAQWRTAGPGAPNAHLHVLRGAAPR